MKKITLVCCIVVLTIASALVVAGSEVKNCENYNVYHDGNLMVITGDPNCFVEALNEVSMEFNIIEAIPWEAHGYHSVIVGIGDEDYSQMPKVEMGYFSQVWAYDFASLDLG